MPVFNRKWLNSWDLPWIESTELEGFIVTLLHFSMEILSDFSISHIRTFQVDIFHLLKGTSSMIVTCIADRPGFVNADN